MSRKLTQQQADDIRYIHTTYRVTAREIAQHLGVSVWTVYDILAGKLYKKQ